ncbi:SNF2-related protein [Lactonifactor longoviformis]|uniref:SNF2-related protein n=1 Tax=Lactonifactor longoviformis TaxID=341220 RepID=UPI0036F2397C
MRYEPHEYQRYATEYIETHPIAAVLLDMGLGKTSITLTALSSLLFDRFLIRRVLVIAPLRVARDTWPAELEKWEHLNGLRYSVAVGTEAERLAALKRQADIYIINRENVQWLIEESGIPFDFDMVVVDELSSFKNHQAKRFRALMKVRPRVERIVGLTGTPSSNGLMDLWAEFRLLDKGERLGRFIGQYRTRFFQPDKRNGQVIFSYKPLPGAEQQICKLISDITISMKSTDYLQMPELVSTRYEAYLSEAERERYEELKKDLVLQLPDGDVTAANAAALSGKLSQMANGAVYTDSGETISIHDRKLDALEDIIESMGGKPLLVAYWFQYDLERITERLHKLKIPFSRMDSSESIRRWNAGELPVALIHPASAGHGLNLQSGGSAIVWFGLTWSLELYQQTNARLWRQGQTSETVVVQHIVTKGTIDEQILKALDAKDTTQTALIDAVKADLKL